MFPGKTSHLADWTSAQADVESETHQASLHDGLWVLNPNHRELGQDVKDVGLSAQSIAVLKEDSVTVTGPPPDG